MAQFRTDKNIIDSGQVFTRYEIMMLSDRLTPSGTATDAFGRLRVSEPYTIFDSQHQDVENDKWDTLITGSGTKTHLPNESSIKLEVGTANNDSIIRETLRVMPYQPGKSLLIMNTFVMGTPKANTVQRVGYFTTNNGVYLENDSGNNYIVLRSTVTGNVAEIKVAQSDWNVDTFDGSGYSGQGSAEEHKNGLDVSKSNLFWMDIEWLGVGDVRCGFLVDGILKTAHVFHNDNRNSTTYMRSAILPLRYEIYNKGITSSNTAMRQICSTVISEGGYNQLNQSRSISTPIAGKNLAKADNPMISIRLKTNRLNAVVIPVAVDLYGIQATAFKYKIFENVTSLTNASWNTTDTASAVEYDISATAMTGGVLIREGIFKGLETAKEIDLLGHLGNSIQLTRKLNAANGDIFTVAIEPTTNNDDAIVSLSWQEHIN